MAIAAAFFFVYGRLWCQNHKKMSYCNQIRKTNVVSYVTHKRPYTSTMEPSPAHLWP